MARLEEDTTLTVTEIDAHLETATTICTFVSQGTQTIDHSLLEGTLSDTEQMFRDMNLEIALDCTEVNDSFVSDNLTSNVHVLTATCSRNVDVTSRQINDLRECISSVEELISALRSSAPLPRPPPACPSTPRPPPACPSTPRRLPSAPNLNGTNSTDTGTITNKPFTKFSGALLFNFKLELLDADTTYDKTFNNRKVAHYGTVPYQYSGANHAARSPSENKYLTEIMSAVRDLCSDTDLNFEQFNSITVTKYDSPQSSIPPHSDDTNELPNSSILCVSLGGTRNVVFRRKPPAEYFETSLEVKHGEVYTMTRASQDHFDHAVPRVSPDNYSGPRISVTFRALSTAQGPNSSKSRNTQHPTSQQTPKRKVLILSDSKNMTFDCSMFQDPVVAFRRNMFYLRDLEHHREAIEHADIVLISAGLNDVRRNKADALTLHDHMKHFVAQFPNTQFLFDSVSPLAMHADRFNVVNSCVDKLNEFLLKFSLRTSNFRLIDNLCLGLPHLTKDGIHFNMAGKSVLSRFWVNCILIRLGLMRGALPIRQEFRVIADEYYSRNWRVG